MFIRNPHAVYINCDGAMDYDKDNTGGIGFVISFPDNVPIEEISISKGGYIGGNIEKIEYEALIQAMEYSLGLFEKYKEELKNVRQIIFISDRFALNDNERTDPYKIQAWRKNKWKNHEGKPVKNNDLLDKLDKTRKKLSQQTQTRVNIQYRPRKQNKQADKLAKKAKGEGLKNYSLAKKGEKIGKRIFDGAEIKYIKLSPRSEVHIHIFRKDPAQDQWEVWAEIYSGVNSGEKLKIYVDDALAAKLKRRNFYLVKVKEVFKFHITIHRTIKKRKYTPLNSVGIAAKS